MTWFLAFALIAAIVVAAFLATGYNPIPTQPKRTSAAFAGPAREPAAS